MHLRSYKYILISFVVSITLIAYWEFNFSEQEIIPTTLFEVVILSFWYIFLYLNIGKHIKDV